MLCGPPQELWRVHAGGIERIPEGTDCPRNPVPLILLTFPHSARYSSVPSTVSSFSVARSASLATSSTRRGSSSRSTATRPTISSSSRSTRPASSSRSVSRRLPRFHCLLRPLPPASSLCLRFSGAFPSSLCSRFLSPCLVGSLSGGQMQTFVAVLHEGLLSWRAKARERIHVKTRSGAGSRVTGPCDRRDAAL